MYVLVYSPFNSPNSNYICSPAFRVLGCSPAWRARLCSSCLASACSLTGLTSAPVARTSWPLASSFFMLSFFRCEQSTSRICVAAFWVTFGTFSLCFYILVSVMFDACSVETARTTASFVVYVLSVMRSWLHCTNCYMLLNWTIAVNDDL